MLRRGSDATIVFVCGDTVLARWPLACPEDRPSLALVEELARLQLWAHRLGCKIALSDASQHLIELLDLVGLADIIRWFDPSAIEAGGEIEDGEQAHVDEGGPDDSIT